MEWMKQLLRNMNRIRRTKINLWHGRRFVSKETNAKIVPKNSRSNFSVKPHSLVFSIDAGDRALKFSRGARHVGAGSKSFLGGSEWFLATNPREVIETKQISIWIRWWKPKIWRTFGRAPSSQSVHLSALTLRDPWAKHLILSYLFWAIRKKVMTIDNKKYGTAFKKTIEEAMNTKNSKKPIKSLVYANNLLDDRQTRIGQMSVGETLVGTFNTCVQIYGCASLIFFGDNPKIRLQIKSSTICRIGHINILEYFSRKRWIQNPATRRVPESKCSSSFHLVHTRRIIKRY